MLLLESFFYNSSLKVDFKPIIEELGGSKDGGTVGSYYLKNAIRKFYFSKTDIGSKTSVDLNILTIVGLKLDC